MIPAHMSQRSSQCFHSIGVSLHLRLGSWVLGLGQSLSASCYCVQAQVNASLPRLNEAAEAEREEGIQSQPAVIVVRVVAKESYL